MKDKNQIKAKKRVHWRAEDEQELKAHEKSKSRKKPKFKNAEDKKLYELGKNRWERFADERDYDGLMEYCKNLASKDKKVMKAKDEYGEDSEKARQAEKKEISSLLSAFKFLLFEKACVRSDLNFMQFLTGNFTEYDLKRNIMYENFLPFGVYLMSNNHRPGDQQRREFIEGLKIFLKIVDTTVGALNHYIACIAGKYKATDEMREDFILALKQAKKEGIIKNIDLAEIKAIQDSYKDKENMTDFSFVERLQTERDNNNSLIKALM